MIKDLFGSVAAIPGSDSADRLMHVDLRLRAFLRCALATTLQFNALDRMTAAANDNGGAVRTAAAEIDNIKILELLHEALSNSRGAALLYEYESVLPLADIYQYEMFHEGLVRLHDYSTGRIYTPPEIFRALYDESSGVLNNKLPNAPPSTGIDCTLDVMFRAWLIAGMIRDFYRLRPATKKLSLNMSPADTDLKEYQETARCILSLAAESGFKNIIIEALEHQPWLEHRRTFLQSLQIFGINIALDDYGAEKGYNYKHTIDDFSENSGLNHPLIIKLDGQVVRNFLEKDDEALVRRLREIKAHSPGSLIVAEWLNSVEEVLELNRKLIYYGLNGSIHMIQGAYIKDTPLEFLTKLGKTAFRGGTPSIS